MKYYTKQIKPYMRLTVLGGDAGYAVDGYDWVPEDMEDELRKNIINTDGLFVLTFKERFVEVPNETIL